MNQFQKALSDAILKSGQIHQKMRNLSTEQQKQLFGRIEPFMIQDEGFYALSGHLRDVTGQKIKDTAAELVSMAVEGRMFYFHFYKEPVRYWYTKSYDDCVFSENCIDVVGSMSFSYILETGFMPPQQLWLEFVFEDKFLNKIKDAINQ